MENKKDTKRIIITKGLIVLAFIGLGLIAFSTVKKEVSKYTQSWQEIQFAKNHPMLVQPMREYYERGVEALDKLTVEQNVPTPKQSN
jgi:hypothetical protein